VFQRSEAKRLQRAKDVEALLVLAENGSQKDRFEALFALVDMQLDDSQRRRLAEEAAVALTDSTSDDVRGAGAFVLGTLRVADAVPALLDVLETGGSYPRMMAAAALGWLAPSEALEPLVRTAETHEDELVRDQATRALGSYPSARETLRSLGTNAARDALHELGGEA
jgi:HEAT repeat protein